MLSLSSTTGNRQQMHNRLPQYFQTVISTWKEIRRFLGQSSRRIYSNGMDPVGPSEEEMLQKRPNE